MEIREIIVDVKRSINYQTYGVSEVITIQEGDDIEKVKQEALDRCNALALKQSEPEEPEEEQEEPQQVGYTIRKG